MAVETTAMVVDRGLLEIGACVGDVDAGRAVEQRALLVAGAGLV